MMSDGSSRIEAGKILVWGHLGEDLKKLDPERILAIAQADPKYYLALISNREIESIIDLVMEGGLTPEIEAFVASCNQKQAVFKEVAEFLQASGDMLSTGSFLTGELENDKALLRLMEED